MTRALHRPLALLLAAPLIGLSLLVTLRPALAQSGTITATASILLLPVTGAGLRPLTFGEVTAGVDKDIPTTTDESGWFQLQNIQRNSDVELTFSFPTQLARVGGATGMYHGAIQLIYAIL